MQLIIITGLSGSGKSVALKALEDGAHYTADNLPAKLLPEMVDFLQGAGYTRVAVSIDARSGDTLSELPRQVSVLVLLGGQGSLQSRDLSGPVDRGRPRILKRLHPHIAAHRVLLRCKFLGRQTTR